MQQPLAAERVVVGSKDFNEGYLLSEVVAQLLEHAGYEVERRFGLGGTLICYEALKHDEIDVYIEYTGTLSRAILKLDATPSLPELNAALAADDVEMLGGFGFDNTYALAMKATRADALDIGKISDLVHGHRDLKVVVSHEFLQRADGWPGLVAAYGFDWYPGGIEHGLAYQALEDGAIDVTDIYSTDGEVARYGLRVLDDDRRYFPEYRAVPLVRSDLPAAGQSDDQRIGKQYRQFADAALQLAGHVRRRQLSTRGIRRSDAAGHRLDRCVGAGSDVEVAAPQYARSPAVDRHRARSLPSWQVCCSGSPYIARAGCRGRWCTSPVCCRRSRRSRCWG